MTDRIHPASEGVPDPSRIGSSDPEHERLPVAVLVLDVEGGIRGVNKAMAALLGWRLDWLHGQRFQRWLMPEHLRRFERHLVDTFDNPGRVTRETLQLKGRDGRLVDISLQSLVDGVQPGRCRTVVLDVTDSRQAERKARLLQRELAHLARVNSMGEFAGSLAHELNQPLGAVVLYCRAALKLVQAGTSDHDRLLGALRQATEAAERAGETLRHLNRFLRKETGDREVVGLNELVAEVARIMAAAAEDQGCVIELDPAGASPHACVDKVQIEQVLINLVQNGIDAMAGTDSLPKKIVISTHAAVDGRVGISVRDTGPGLSAAKAARVFEPFFTTKPRGLGLGLAISQSIVEAHSGRFWVESENLNGSVFHLRIPAARRP